MSIETSQKVTASQLKRSAFLYIRQSTPRQVLEHTESTARQYALRKRAVALGWQEEQVIVIDSDLGQSGASAVDREGFQKLVVEVSMGRAGIVRGSRFHVLRGTRPIGIACLRSALLRIHSSWTRMAFIIPETLMIAFSLG